mmetsp:Transcript_9617/g.30442  ORF Transcript_9617/g.30442 Transcript_9617/m.30442 type:complete len:388 (+) Transcript_9617:749-1912(+)
MRPVVGSGPGVELRRQLAEGVVTAARGEEPRRQSAAHVDETEAEHAGGACDGVEPRLERLAGDDVRVGPHAAVGCEQVGAHEVGEEGHRRLAPHGRQHVLVLDPHAERRVARVQLHEPPARVGPPPRVARQPRGARRTTPALRPEDEDSPRQHVVGPCTRRACAAAALKQPSASRVQRSPRALRPVGRRTWRRHRHRHRHRHSWWLGPSIQPEAEPRPCKLTEPADERRRRRAHRRVRVYARPAASHTKACAIHDGTGGVGHGGHGKVVAKRRDRRVRLGGEIRARQERGGRSGRRAAALTHDPGAPQRLGAAAVVCALCRHRVERRPEVCGRHVAATVDLEASARSGSRLPQTIRRLARLARVALGASRQQPAALERCAQRLWAED